MNFNRFWGQAFLTKHTRSSHLHTERYATNTNRRLVHFNNILGQQPKQKYY